MRRLAGWGYPASLIDPGQAAEIEPSLRLPSGMGAVGWFPGEGYLLTDQMAGDVTPLLVRRGAAMVTGEPGRVTGFDTADGRVRALRTAAGQVIPADAVACCAGRWVPELAALAGAAGPVPLVPWAGPGATAPGLVVLAGPTAAPGPRRVAHGPEIFLRPDAGGLVHLEAPDAAVNLHTPDSDLRRWADELLRRARAAVDGLHDAAVVDYRVCVRPMPADGRSIVGWMPGVGGLYVAVTHSGVTLAAHLARLIAGELTGGAAAPGLAAYRPGRAFPRKRPGR